VSPPSPTRPTPIEWLYLIAGLYLVFHYAWLLDDAYVYFRYIDNWLLLGRGLVYNPGEYAEGYTSPAWLLLLAALRSLGMGYWLMVRLLAVASFALFWWIGVLVNRQLSPPGAPTANLPLAFLSLNYAVLCYFTSGTEGPLVQLAAAVFVLFALRPTWAPLQYLLPLLPLVRPELALALVAALLWYRLKTGRLPWLMGAISVLIGGGWLLFRILYYADLFPTTYYLKNISAVHQGLLFVHDTFGPYHLYELILLGGVALALAVRRIGWEALALDARAFVWLVALAELLYTVKVGGDARHYRYLAFPVCAAVLAFAGLAEERLSYWLSGAPGNEWRRQAAIGAGLAFALFSFALIPRQLDHHPAFNIHSQPLFADKIADAAHHRVHPSAFSPLPWESGARIELRPAYEEWRRHGGSDPPTEILRGYICYRLYRHFDEWVIQSYGLTEAILARVDMPFDRPAHKDGLWPLAGDLERVVTWWARPPTQGMYRAAVEAGVAAPWIRRNLETFELLERKLYNSHNLLENLALALHVWERIDASEPDRGAEADNDESPLRG
jgi:hypothetical protein